MELLFSFLFGMLFRHRDNKIMMVLEVFRGLSHSLLGNWLILPWNWSLTLPPISHLLIIYDNLPIIPDTMQPLHLRHNSWIIC